MLSETAGTPLPLCPLPAQHSLGSRPSRESKSPKRTPRATGLSGLGFLVFVVVFSQIKFQKSRFKNNREMQASPLSCLAKTNPQQEPKCNLTPLTHFQTPARLCFGWGGKRLLEVEKDREPGAGRKPSPDAWPGTRPCGQTAVRDRCEVQFFLGGSLLVLSLVRAGRSKQLWKMVSAVIQNSFSFPGGHRLLLKPAFPHHDLGNRLVVTASSVQTHTHNTLQLPLLCSVVYFLTCHLS